MSDQIAVLSFYLAMVTLLTTVFFVRLDSWFSEILALEKIVGRHGEDNRGVKLESEIKGDLSIKRVGLEAASPWRGYAFVAFFIVVISVLAGFLGTTIDQNKLSIAEWFLFFPGGLFVIMFLVGASWSIRDGENRLSLINDAIKML
jgi:uncharacterized membrane protein (DUF485 family)